MQHSVHGAVTAKVSASVANLGPGFDVHSISLQKPTIEVTLSKSNSGLGLVRVTGPYAKIVTTDPALHAGARTLKTLNQQYLTRHYHVAPAEPNPKLSFAFDPRKGERGCGKRKDRMGLDWWEFSACQFDGDSSGFLVEV